MGEGETGSPQEAPRRPQESSMRLQESLKRPQEPVKRAQDPPRSHQNTSKEHYPKDNCAYQCRRYRRDRQRQNTSNPKGNKKEAGGRRCSPLGEAIRRHPKGRSVSEQFSKLSSNSSNSKSQARARAFRRANSSNSICPPNSVQNSIQKSIKISMSFWSRF